MRSILIDTSSHVCKDLNARIELHEEITGNVPNIIFVTPHQHDCIWDDFIAGYKDLDVRILRDDIRMSVIE